MERIYLVRDPGKVRDLLENPSGAPRSPWLDDDTPITAGEISTLENPLKAHGYQIITLEGRTYLYVKAPKEVIDFVDSWLGELVEPVFGEEAEKVKKELEKEEEDIMAGLSLLP